MQSYVTANPTVAQQYLGSNTTALAQYVTGSQATLSAYLTSNPATLIEYTANNSNGLLVETAIFVTLYQGKQYQLIFVTTPENEDAFVANAKPFFDSWQFT